MARANAATRFFMFFPRPLGGAGIVCLVNAVPTPHGGPPCTSKPLFDWESLEDSPSLKTIREVLAAILDGPLLHSLQCARGKGRNDYPLRVLWGTFLLRIALRHTTTEACLAELRRNEGLRRLVGIPSEKRVPKAWNMSRFEETLGEEPHRTHLKAIFNGMVQRLASVVPDQGKDTAGERVNARLKAFWGVDDGDIRGARRFFANVGGVLVVQSAFATLLAAAPRREGKLGKLKFSPIAKALMAKLAG